MILGSKITTATKHLSVSQTTIIVSMSSNHEEALHIEIPSSFEATGSSRCQPCEVWGSIDETEKQEKVKVTKKHHLGLKFGGGIRARALSRCLLREGLMMLGCWRFRIVRWRQKGALTTSRLLHL